MRPAASSASRGRADVLQVTKAGRSTASSGRSVTGLRAALDADLPDLAGRIVHFEIDVAIIVDSDRIAGHHAFRFAIGPARKDLLRAHRHAPVREEARIVRDDPVDPVVGGHCQPVKRVGRGIRMRDRDGPARLSLQRQQVGQ